LGRRVRGRTGTVSWALIAFTLSEAVFTPLFAKLSDVYGHRRILPILVGCVATGCVRIAAAPPSGC
jgi:MFS family permease